MVLARLSTLGLQFILQLGLVTSCIALPWLA